MSIAGIVITFVGFLIAVFSLNLSSGVTGRLIIVLIGIAVSLVGIIAVLNPAFQKNAVWRK